MTKNPTDDEWIIGADFNNKRIDYFLKKKLPSLSYPIICKIIRKGQLKVNENPETLEDISEDNEIDFEDI